MCGIAGIIQYQTRDFHKDHLEKMTTAIAHRGPDGQALWQNEDGTALLGHRRLSIIDLSAAAAQPMHFLDRYSIVHNGEIYNYIELREELEKEGYQFRTKSDTEVILAAYDFWYDECVEHFDGMFSFAIWDEEERELFAARDRFGEKPFFYHFENGVFIFASEMKAIWAAGIAKQPNLQMLFNFITIGYVDNPAIPEETFYNNIFKLPPASRLTYDAVDNHLGIFKYWDIDTSQRNKKITEKDAIEKFDELLTTSVKKRLRSDVTIGSSLSGGLDSSAVASIIHELKKNAGTQTGPFKSFTAAFDGFDKDEAPFAKKVASELGLEHHLSNIGADDLLDNWEKVCYHQEEPFGSASVFPQYKVFELASQNRIRVMLDGQGADEVLAGYHKYYKWYWQELFIKRKLVSSGELKAARALGVTETFGVKNVVASLFPDFASVILERQYLLKALRMEDLNREFVRLQSKEAYYSTPAIFNLNGVLYFNTIEHGLEELLRYADRNSMAHGVETRLPFLSHELVEYVFSLPSHFKIREGWTKWILRASMKNRLPEDITWRKDKIGFEPPQQLWMQSIKVQNAVKEARKKLVEEKILKPSVIDLPVRALPGHAPDNYDWRYLAAAQFI